MKLENCTLLTEGVKWLREHTGADFANNADLQMTKVEPTESPLEARREAARVFADRAADQGGKQVSHADAENGLAHPNAIECLPAVEAEWVNAPDK